jgi:hypothetical protein
MSAFLTSFRARTHAHSQAQNCAFIVIDRNTGTGKHPDVPEINVLDNMHRALQGLLPMHGDSKHLFDADRVLHAVQGECQCVPCCVTLLVQTVVAPQSTVR